MVSRGVRGYLRRSPNVRWIGRKWRTQSYDSSAGDVRPCIQHDRFGNAFGVGAASTTASCEHSPEDASATLGRFHASERNLTPA